MKIQFRSILFALVLPAAACGGDRETPTVTETPSTTKTGFDYQPKSEPVTKSTPVQEQPKVIDVEIPIPTKFDEALAMGRELAAKGETSRAKEVLEAAIKLDKKKAEPHIELARMFITMNERALAISSANKAVKLAPLSSQAWNTKGRAELNRHDYEGAIEAFSKAVELNQDNTFAWNNLGYTELLLKRYEDAAEHLMEATSKQGATGYMFNNLGTALEHLDRVDDARVAYEAGGQLGSKEAVASRARLEGVKSIAIAKSDEIKGEVHDEVRGEALPVKEYELTDEGETIEEDKVEDTVDAEDSDDNATM